MPTLKEKEAELQTLQEKAAKVFQEAKTDNGSYDFTKSESLGVKSNAEAVERVRAMNDDLEKLAKEVEGLRDAERGAGLVDDLNKKSGGMRHPTGEKKTDHPIQMKSLGELIAKSEKYQQWAKAGAAGGLTFNMDDLLPSDIIAKGSIPETIQQKTLFQTTAGWAPESLRIGGFVEAVTRPIQLLDIIPLGRTGMEQIVFMEETTRTHNAAETAEGGTYPEDAFVLTEKTSNVRKIATSIPVTDEQLEDVAQAESYLNSRLTFGLRQRLDTQVLTGDGAGSNLTGIKNVSGINTQAKGTDPTPDAFFKAMRKIRVTGRAMPTHIVMHPEDWEEIRLLRTADGIYIWGNPSEAGPERMWGLPVIQSDIDSAGTGYVGSFQSQWISLFERRGVDVQVGYVGTQFTEGKRTIRGDMRAAFVVFRPAAFSTVTGI